MTDLKKKSIETVQWNLIAKFSQYFITFFLSIILARYISPAEYGLTGMLSIFISISNILLNSGLSSALVRDKKASKDDYSTVFYFNIIVSCGLYMILFFFAPLIAAFYNEPDLILLTRTITLVFVITAFGLIQNTILIKELDFKKQTILNLISLLVSIVVAIYMAVNNWGVYAIVGQTLIQAAVLTILLWGTSKWRPIGQFSKNSFLKLWKFGSNVLFTGIFNSIANNIDNLMIGKIFQPAILGHFVRAKSTKAIPENIFSGVIGTTVFSILSKLNDNLEEFRTKQFLFFKIIVVFSLPLTVIFFLLSSNLVLILYGQKWAEAIPSLQILSFTLFPSLLTTLTGQTIMTLGDSRLVLYLSIFKRSLNFVVIPLGIFISLKVFIIGFVIIQYIGFFVDLFFVSKKVQSSVWEYYLFMIKPIIISLVILIFGFYIFPFINFGIVANTILIGLISFSMYFGLYFVFQKKELYGLVSILPINRFKK